MTRIKANKDIIKLYNQGFLSDELTAFVNKIYDDFENQVCDNCEECSSEKSDDRFYHWCSELTKWVRTDFSCNKWHSKND